MKLRAKIQVLFSLIIIMTLVIVTMCSKNMQYNSSLKLLGDNLATSASIASNYIGQHLMDYQHIITAIGQSELLSGNASVEEKTEYVNGYVETFGLTSANILDEKGVSIIDGTDFSDRDYVKKALKGESNISELTLSRYTNTYGFSISAPIVNGKNKITGVVYFRMDMSYIQKLLDSFQVVDGSYAYIVDENGMVIAHPDKEVINAVNLKEQKNGLDVIAKKLEEKAAGSDDYEYNNVSLECGYSPIINTNGWSLVIATSTEAIMGEAVDVSNTIMMIAGIACIIGLIIVALFANYVSRPIIHIKDGLVKIAEGDFSVSIPKVERKDEIGILQNATASLIETLAQIIGQTNQVLESMAAYDLTERNIADYPGTFNTLSSSVNRIKAIFHQLIVRVQYSVVNVDSGAQQLTMAAEALSQGTLAQANAIQLLSSNLNDILDETNNNFENEEIVNDKLNILEQQIKNSNSQMNVLLEVVQEIENMSADIRKIVATIDSIAFQTNILSLNASVEASRAGDKGRGFAVVAQEIRSLAEKCSDSSKRTEILVNKCLDSISTAKDYADSTMESLAVIVTGSEEIATAFDSIAEATKEQVNKSHQIRKEVDTISDVVNSNTATAEETSASAETLSEQAYDLKKMIQRFRV